MVNSPNHSLPLQDNKPKGAERMTINTTARNTTIRDSFQRSLEKKLSKLNRFFDDDTAAKVTVSHQSGRETVEVTIRNNDIVYRSEKTTNDRLDSLDLVVDALFRQIVKNKSKLQKRMRKTAFEPGYDDDFTGTEDSFEIVRTKRFNVKPMDIDEAILQMNLSEHNFYMFRSSESNEVCIVYRRNDGKYGVLEAEA